MCGISGVVGAKAALRSILITTAQEDRGFKSTGVAYLNGNGIELSKDTKRPKKFLDEHKEALSQLTGTIAIGHNRWPSLGDVTMENTHPFISCDGKFALVHNGHGRIPDEIQKFIKEHHTVTGQTDSEELMHIIEDLVRAHHDDYVGALKEFYRKTNRMSVGYAILLLTNDGRIYGIRNGNPITIGMADHQIFIASEEFGLTGIDELVGKKIKVCEPNIGTVVEIENNSEGPLARFHGEYRKKENYELHKWKQAYWSSSFNTDDDDEELDTVQSSLSAQKLNIGDFKVGNKVDFEWEDKSGKVWKTGVVMEVSANYVTVRSDKMNLAFSASSIEGGYIRKRKEQGQTPPQGAGKKWWKKQKKKERREQRQLENAQNRQVQRNTSISNIHSAAIKRTIESGTSLTSQVSVAPRTDSISFERVICPQCNGQKVYRTTANLSGFTECVRCRGEGKITVTRRKVVEPGTGNTAFVQENVAANIPVSDLVKTEEKTEEVKQGDAPKETKEEVNN